MDTKDFRAAARAILAANDRGGYTVPTDGLYPFQWNWDSAFVAMGFAGYDVDRALRELERLVEGQWADGMIPHIVFHQPSESYFPGPEVWGTSHRIGTSGITQPPVFGMALRAIAEAKGFSEAPQGEDRLRSLFAAAVRSHRWWRKARDPDNTGLVAILHNWESGSDNSPAWDEAFRRIPTTTRTVIRRKDIDHVGSAMRPTDDDYRRYIHLVDLYRDCCWQPEAQWRLAPFKIAEVQMTAILAKATEDLLVLADRLGTPDDAVFLAELHTSLVAGLRRQWRPALSRFVSRDLISGQDIDTPTQAGFIPLLALDLEPQQVTQMLAELMRWLDACRLKLLPSVPVFSSSFDSRRYWRGPVWIVINWLVADGLMRNGARNEAQQLRHAMRVCIEREGFCEYFDPLTGEGLGGHGFTWTAASYLECTARDPAGGHAAVKADGRGLTNLPPSGA